LIVFFEVCCAATGLDKINVPMISNKERSWEETLRIFMVEWL
jgi:hypothetical protein